MFGGRRVEVALTMIFLTTPGGVNSLPSIAAKPTLTRIVGRSNSDSLVARHLAFLTLNLPNQAVVQDAREKCSLGTFVNNG